MKANPTFLSMDRPFWACVRSLSQKIGYSKKGDIVVPSVRQMTNAFAALDLNPDLIGIGTNPTRLGTNLAEYFQARHDALHLHAEPNLMSLANAKVEFERHRKRLSPRCPIPMNKQKGEKRAEAYLTGIVNMLIEEQLGQRACDHDPRQLATFTANGLPLRTLARRVDGAFPSTVNPIAIWEIKEYYYTTTFGSRVADGVYETLLDGTELQELRDNEGINVLHYMMVDAYYTWWDCGKSYLCRMYDMLNMSLVTEILFGREVISELPRIVAEWAAIADS